MSTKNDAYKFWHHWRPYWMSSWNWMILFEIPITCTTCIPNMVSPDQVVSEDSIFALKLKTSGSHIWWCHLLKKVIGSIPGWGQCDGKKKREENQFQKFLAEIGAQVLTIRNNYNKKQNKCNRSFDCCWKP